MNPLLVYGYVCHKLSQPDLLAMPRSLQTVSVCEAFAAKVSELYSGSGGINNTSANSTDTKPAAPQPKHPLLAAFNRLYGWQYYPLGLVKLVADLSNFAGPILLHELVDMVERPDSNVGNAYIYAALLCASSLFGSICNTQYSFRVSKVQVAARAAIVTSVFRKAMRKRLGQAEPDADKKENAKEENVDKNNKDDVDATAFSTTGQVINLMSTDCDRIANFCPRSVLWPICVVCKQYNSALFFSRCSQLPSILEFAGASGGGALPAVQSGAV